MATKVSRPRIEHLLLLTVYVLACLMHHSCGWLFQSSRSIGTRIISSNNRLYCTSSSNSNSNSDRDSIIDNSRSLRTDEEPVVTESSNRFNSLFLQEAKRLREEAESLENGTKTTTTTTTTTAAAAAAATKSSEKSNDATDSTPASPTEAATAAVSIDSSTTTTAAVPSWISFVSNTPKRRHLGDRPDSYSDYKRINNNNNNNNNNNQTTTTTTLTNGTTSTTTSGTIFSTNQQQQQQQQQLGEEKEKKYAILVQRGEKRRLQRLAQRISGDKSRSSNNNNNSSNSTTPQQQQQQQQQQEQQQWPDGIKLAAAVGRENNFTALGGVFIDENIEFLNGSNSPPLTTATTTSITSTAAAAARIEEVIALRRPLLNDIPNFLRKRRLQEISGDSRLLELPITAAATAAPSSSAAAAAESEKVAVAVAAVKGNKIPSRKEMQQPMFRCTAKFSDFDSGVLRISEFFYFAAVLNGAELLEKLSLFWCLHGVLEVTIVKHPAVATDTTTTAATTAAGVSVPYFDDNDCMLEFVYGAKRLQSAREVEKALVTQFTALRDEAGQLFDFETAPIYSFRIARDLQMIVSQPEDSKGRSSIGVEFNSVESMLLEAAWYQEYAEEWKLLNKDRTAEEDALLPDVFNRDDIEMRMRIRGEALLDKYCFPSADTSAAAAAAAVANTAADISTTTVAATNTTANTSAAAVVVTSAGQEKESSLAKNDSFWDEINDITDELKGKGKGKATKKIDNAAVITIATGTKPTTASTTKTPTTSDKATTEATVEEVDEDEAVAAKDDADFVTALEEVIQQLRSGGLKKKSNNNNSNNNNNSSNSNNNNNNNSSSNNNNNSNNNSNNNNSNNNSKSKSKSISSESPFPKQRQSKKQLSRSSRSSSSRSSSSNGEDVSERSMSEILELLQSAASGNERDIIALMSSTSADDDDEDSIRTEADALLLNYFDDDSRMFGLAVGREGAGKFQNEILRGEMSVTGFRLSQGAAIFEGTILDRSSSSSSKRNRGEDKNSRSKSGSSNFSGSSDASEDSSSSDSVELVSFVDRIEAKFNQSVFKDEVDFIVLMNEKLADGNNAESFQSLAMEMLLGVTPCVVVYPKQWNSTLQVISTDPVRNFLLKAISWTVLPLSLYTAATSAGVFTAVGFAAVAERLTFVLPMALTSLLIQNVASFVELTVARSRNVQLSSVLLPALKGLFNYGSRSSYLTMPRNNKDAFDIALSGVGTAILLSFAATYAGLALTTDAPRELLNTFPSIPVSLLRSNTIIWQIFAPLVSTGDLDITTTAVEAVAASTTTAATAATAVATTAAAVSSAATTTTTTAAAAAAAGDASVHLHWLCIAGATSFISSIFQLIPLDNSAGSKLVLARLGRSNFSLVAAATALFKVFFLAVMIFDVGGISSGVAITKSKLLLDFILVSQAAGSDEQMQINKDNITELDRSREYLFTAVALLLLLSFFPYADVSEQLSSQINSAIEYLRDIVSSSSSSFGSSSDSSSNNFF